MRHIKNFKTYIINENNNSEDGFMEFVKNLVNDCRILSPEEYIEILKENKEILNEFYNKFKEEPRSIVIYINSEIKRLLEYLSVSDLLKEFGEKESLKSILDKYEDHRKKIPDRMRSSFI